MNSSDPPTPTAEQPALLPEPAASDPETPTPFAYRGNGKVARLPKPIRDQINHWILDGVSYPDIIQRLAYPAKPPDLLFRRVAELPLILLRRQKVAFRRLLAHHPAELCAPSAPVS